MTDVTTMTAPVCIHCNGWECARCKPDRVRAQPGEQGLEAVELENARLRKVLADLVESERPIRGVMRDEVEALWVAAEEVLRG